MIKYYMGVRFGSPNSPPTKGGGKKTMCLEDFEAISQQVKKSAQINPISASQKDFTRKITSLMKDPFFKAPRTISLTLIFNSKEKRKSFFTQRRPSWKGECNDRESISN
jgi:hypothetical protein